MKIKDWVCPECGMNDNDYQWVKFFKRQSLICGEKFSIFKRYKRYRYQNETEEFQSKDTFIPISDEDYMNFPISNYKGVRIIIDGSDFIIKTETIKKLIKNIEKEIITPSKYSYAHKEKI